MLLLQDSDICWYPGMLYKVALTIDAVDVSSNMSVQTIAFY